MPGVFGIGLSVSDALGRTERARALREGFGWLGKAHGDVLVAQQCLLLTSLTHRRASLFPTAIEAMCRALASARGGNAAIAAAVSLVRPDRPDGTGGAASPLPIPKELQ